MKIYHYHPDSFAYLGTSDADESPLEPGVYLIPAHATEAMPPADIPDGGYAKFVDDGWVTETAPAETPSADPVETAPSDPNAEIKRSISRLEYSQARAIREAVLTGDQTRLKVIDDQIAELRAQLK